MSNKTRVIPTEQIMDKLVEYHNQVITVKSTETLIRELNLKTSKAAVSAKAKARREKAK